MSARFDVIVVGAGHNGLVSACYLAKSGLNVAVVERRDEVGGAVCTREMFGGYRMDVGGSVHIMINATPIVEDLHLEQHGLEYIELDPWAWHPGRDGNWFAFYRDVDTTCESIARVSERDADAYREFVGFWQTINEGVFDAFLKPPTPWNLGRTIMSGRFGKKKDIPATLRRIFSSYGEEILGQFESESVRAAMLWFAAQSGPPQTEPMTADFAGWQAMIHSIGARRPRRGSGMLSVALGRRLEADGGTLLLDSEVRRIVVRDGRARGVEMVDGEYLEARHAVVAATHISTSMLKLLDGPDLPDSTRTSVSQLNIGNGFGMVLRCASTELPHYRGVEESNSGTAAPWHTGMQLLCPTPEYLSSAYGDYLTGIPSRKPPCLVMTFSAIDSTLAPADKHTVFIWSQYHPYRLADGREWSDIRDEVATSIIETVGEYAPNLPSSITDVYIQTPEDIERLHGMPHGNVMHLDMSFNQMFYFRPTPELSGYKTPIDRLFLTGASTHPGGGIFGASGYNTAHVVLKEIGRRARRSRGTSK